MSTSNNIIILKTVPYRNGIYFHVQGESGHEYIVDCNFQKGWICDCPDHIYRHGFCKHMRACSEYAERKGLRLPVKVWWDDPKSDMVFEEFFKENYKEDVFEILETYPDNNSLFVNYNELEVFDPDLVDLLITKPETVIGAAQTAVKNINPLAKGADLNIKFKNVTNIIPFERLDSKYVGSFVVLEDVVIVDVEKPKPIIDTAAFECRGCLRLHYVEQTSVNHIFNPKTLIKFIKRFGGGR